MPFGHEQLDVYRVSSRFTAWACETADHSSGIDRHAPEHLHRAWQWNAFSFAEGNGKGTGADRRGFFEIAGGSALKCGSIAD